jgi:L-lysine 2,3-aminomutase
VNDDVKTMGTLIRSLADMNIQPVSIRGTHTLFAPAVV